MLHRLGGELRVLGEDLQELVAAFLPVEDRTGHIVLLDQLGESPPVSFHRRDMSSWRMSLKTLGVAALLISTAACGGASSKTASTAPTAAEPVASASPAALSQKQQADAYLAAVAPANSALSAYKTKITDNSTQAEVAAASAPVADAIEQVDNALARIAFTGQTAIDVRAVIATAGVLVGDFRSVGSQNAFSVSKFDATLSRDVGAANAAVAIVRADLGLPPKN